MGIAVDGEMSGKMAAVCFLPGVFLMSDSLLEFPCDFPIKIMGEVRDDFVQVMVTVVKAHAPEFDTASVKTRASARGRYLALTCTVHAISRDQLDNLYRELSSHPYVKVVL